MTFIWNSLAHVWMDIISIASLNNYLNASDSFLRICFQFVVDTDVSNLENKWIDLFDGGTEGYREDNVLLASCKFTCFSPTCQFSMICLYSWKLKLSPSCSGHTLLISCRFIRISFILLVVVLLRFLIVVGVIAIIIVKVIFIFHFLFH